MDVAFGKGAKSEFYHFLAFVLLCSIGTMKLSQREQSYEMVLSPGHISMHGLLNGCWAQPHLLALRMM
jgi:hypothetical protein